MICSHVRLQHGPVHRRSNPMTGSWWLLHRLIHPIRGVMCWWNAAWDFQWTCHSWVKCSYFRDWHEISIHEVWEKVLKSVFSDQNAALPHYQDSQSNQLNVPRRWYPFPLHFSSGRLKKPFPRKCHGLVLWLQSSYLLVRLQARWSYFSWDNSFMKLS